MDGSQLGPVLPGVRAEPLSQGNPGRLGGGGMALILPGTPACQPAPPASFPDGCLFIDLAGYAATAAVAPTDALDRLLRRIGVPPSPYLRTPTTARPTFRA